MTDEMNGLCSILQEQGESMLWHVAEGRRVLVNGREGLHIFTNIFTRTLENKDIFRMKYSFMKSSTSKYKVAHKD